MAKNRFCVAQSDHKVARNRGHLACVIWVRSTGKNPHEDQNTACHRGGDCQHLRICPLRRHKQWWMPHRQPNGSLSLPLMCMAKSSPFILAICFSAFALCPTANAQVFKCKDDQGKTIYSDTLCLRTESNRVRINENVISSEGDRRLLDRENERRYGGESQGNRDRRGTADSNRCPTDTDIRNAEAAAGSISLSRRERERAMERVYEMRMCQQENARMHPNVTHSTQQGNSCPTDLEIRNLEITANSISTSRRERERIKERVHEMRMCKTRR